MKSAFANHLRKSPRIMSAKPVGHGHGCGEFSTTDWSVYVRVLTLGVPGADGEVVLMQPSHDVPNGGDVLKSQFDRPFCPFFIRLVT